MITFAMNTMDIIELIKQYQHLGIDQVIDHEKFNLISIVHHSTRIEGSTLTEVETQVLLTEGLTPKGKPLHESLMVTDHYAALQYALEQAKTKHVITPEFIQKLNSFIVKNTASTYNTVFGTIDAATGAFRKGNVVAGETYFPNFNKVEALTKNLAFDLAGRMQQDLSMREQLNLSYDAHLNLVSIHPFYDGNGRTSRLLMNYIQAVFRLPLAIVHNETKTDYYQALIDTRKQEDINIFRAFMDNEYKMLLSAEISKFEEMQHPKKGKGFTFLF
ncbi:Fic family protein [Pedobacter nyackensis]|nr:Fic family protein [Pedobacter nyackensis]